MESSPSRVSKAVKLAAALTWLRVHLAGRLRRINPWLLLILPALYAVTVHVAKGRCPGAHSFAPNMVWGFEWTEQVRHGVLYPRWMEHTHAGLGSPTFHFYGPVCMYALLPFSLLLGLPLSFSIEYSCWLALLVLGLGTARLTRTFLPDRHPWIPGVIGAVTLMSPYAMVDLYQRLAIGELWAMAILPWVLAAFLRSLRSEGYGRRYELVAFTALFALCHPPTLLLAAMCFIVCIPMAMMRRSDLKLVLWRGLVPVIVGLCLDGFYLFSAVGDQRFVDVTSMSSENIYKAFNRMLVTDLGNLSLKTAPDWDGLMVPGFFLCVFIVAAAMIVFHRWAARDCARPAEMRFLLAAAALAALMMTDVTRGVYELFSGLNKVQFAWRWMAILTVLTAPLWGYVLFVIAEDRARLSGTWIVLGGLFTCWLATQSFSAILPGAPWDNPLYARTDRLFTEFAKAGHESDAAALPFKNCRDLICTNAKNELVYGDVEEYRPLTQPVFKQDGRSASRTYPEAEWLTGNGAVAKVEWGPGIRRLAVDSPTGGKLLIRTTAWLGWAISVNGAKEAAGNQAGDTGRMIVAVPPGHSDVRIRYRGTPNQRRGTVLSIATLVLLAFGGLWLRRSRLRTARA